MKRNNHLPNMNEKGQKIISLRKKGHTHSEIVSILKIPKSTVSWWAAKANLTQRQKDKILKKSRGKWRKAITKFNKVNAKVRSDEARAIRDAATNKAKKKIKTISKKELLLIGSSLFWAEGTKSHRYHLCFANSDSEIIRIMMRFFREICDIPNEKIKGLVHIYPQLDYREVLNFWTRITNLPKENFYRPQTQISRASKRKRNSNTLPYGTLHLTAGNTENASIVKGWIQGIAEKI